MLGEQAGVDTISQMRTLGLMDKGLSTVVQG